MLKRRSSGVLMHLTSIPTKYGIGDFGVEAYKFADFLKAAGQNYWQMLPLNHTAARTGFSPYNCFSAFAGNALLISPDLLVEDGLLMRREIGQPPRFPLDSVDYEKVASYKAPLFDAAFSRFREAGRPADYDDFLDRHKLWLEPFVTFVALKRHFKGRQWSDWPAPIRDRKARDLDRVRDRLSDAIDRERFLQYVFYKQYLRLKDYCNRQGIQVAGDVPIYVAYDSADVWSNPELFKLDRSKKAKFKAGVPPDYFSETGQLWGNPVYDWDRLRETDFDWWMQRMKHNLLLFDFVRIDHFRGLVAYWQVPASHKNAMRGKWMDVPHGEFFRELFRQIPFAAMFAEDLGYITADVREVVAKYELPRMNVLQFAFGGDPARNPYMPHNHAENSIVYTGTHDNNTTRGWFEKEVKGEQKRRLFDYLGRRVAAGDVAWELIRLAMASVARIAIVPMQDLLNLPASARMNSPATSEGNWRWRMRPGKADAKLARRLRNLTATYGRT